MIKDNDKIYYSTNWMGPIRQSWLEEHGSDWSGGRIDAYGGDLGPYGDEVGLPIMKTEDWNRFSEWLDDFWSIELYTLEEILNEYYSEDNPEIIWFNPDGF